MHLHDARLGKHLRQRRLGVGCRRGCGSQGGSSRARRRPVAPAAGRATRAGSPARAARGRSGHARTPGPPRGRGWPAAEARSRTARAPPPAARRAGSSAPARRPRRPGTPAGCRRRPSRRCARCRAPRPAGRRCARRPRSGSCRMSLSRSGSLWSWHQPGAPGGSGLAGIGHGAGAQRRGRPDNLAGVDLVGTVQTFVLLLLGIGSLILTGYAFIDVLRHKGTLFPHAGRLSKGVWLGILGVAFLHRDPVLREPEHRRHPQRRRGDRGGGLPRRPAAQAPVARRRPRVVERSLRALLSPR